MRKEDVKVLEALSDQLFATYEQSLPRGPPAFTLMYDDESGCNIQYVKHVPASQFGHSGTETKLMSDGSPASAIGSHTYSGFVQVVWGRSRPIAIADLVSLLRRYGYRIEEFANTFQKPRSPEH